MEMIRSELLPLVNQAELCAEYTRIFGGSIRCISNGIFIYDTPDSWYGRTVIYDFHESDPAMPARELFGRHARLLSFHESCLSDSLLRLIRRLLLTPSVSPRAMVADLMGFSKPEPDAGIVTITENRIGAWTGALDQGYTEESPDPAGSRSAENSSTDYSVFLQSDKVELLGYEADGRLVSTLLLFKGSCAGIHEVSTIPAFRHHGYARKLLSFALHRAKSEGYRTAVLMSTDAGFRLYASMGFTPVGRILHYISPCPIQ